MPGDPYYDANRLYGRVLYVMGLATDEPLAITRMNYADASTDRGDTTWALYAPYSILPLWNDEGRTDRAVMGGTAAPGADTLCAAPGRCAYVGFDRGEFPFARSGSYDGVWQGTLLVDKADATGTYYRRNRSYDPSTGRFTQEDPIGLAGGLNLYGFANGNPVTYSDPFGLCTEGPDSLLVQVEIECGNGEMGTRQVWVKRVKDLETLDNFENSPLDLVVKVKDRGDPQLVGETGLYLETSVGSLYEIPETIDGYHVATAGGVPIGSSSTILLRTDVLNLIRQGKYSAFVPGNPRLQVCQIVFHEGLHMTFNARGVNGPDQDHPVINPMVARSRC